jgi:hypothetical protein
VTGRRQDRSVTSTQRKIPSSLIAETFREFVGVMTVSLDLMYCGQAICADPLGGYELARMPQEFRYLCELSDCMAVQEAIRKD